MPVWSTPGPTDTLQSVDLYSESSAKVKIYNDLAPRYDLGHAAAPALYCIQCA